MLKRLLLIFLSFSPLAAWGFYKPIRVLAPQFVNSISCVSDEICLQDASRYREASGLYEDGLSSVEMSVGKFRHKPRVIFCSTEKCFRSFGFKHASASSVGRSGIVISPRGWASYYMRHEMIHYRQSEELGIFAQWLAPKWFTEGMAYSLSKDPRHPLTEPWEEYRTLFNNWYQKIDKNHLWEVASKL